jgi:hypothetical protein
VGVLQGLFLFPLEAVLLRQFLACRITVFNSAHGRLLPGSMADPAGFKQIVFDDVEIDFHDPVQDHLGKPGEVSLLPFIAFEADELLDVPLDFTGLCFAHGLGLIRENLPNHIDIKKNVVPLSGLFDQVFDRGELFL